MNIRTKNIYTIDTDSVLITFIGFYFLFHALNLFIKLALSEPAWWSLFSKALLAGLLGFSLFVALMRDARIIFSEIVLIGLLLVSAIRGTISTDYTEFNSTIFNFFLVYMPLGMVLYSIKDMEKALNVLYKYAWISSAILLATILVKSRAGVVNAASGSSYNMSIGYSLLFQCLLIFDHYFETRKVKDLLIVLIITVIIALFASRTPLICIIAYVYIRVLKSPHIKSSAKVRLLFGTIVAIAALLLFYAFFAKGVYVFLLNKGYESTALRKLLLNPLDSSSRAQLYQGYLDHLMDNPILGYGLLGGWYLGTYPHNIIVEVLHSFGFILGALIIVILGKLVMHGLNSPNSTLQRIICLLCAYNIHLLLSSSFLTSMTFCMFVAVCLKAKKRSHSFETANM